MNDQLIHKLCDEVAVAMQQGVTAEQAESLLVQKGLDPEIAQVLVVKVASTLAASNAQHAATMDRLSFWAQMIEDCRRMLASGRPLVSIRRQSSIICGCSQADGR